MDEVRQPPNYLHPDVPRGLRRVALPMVEATEETLRGYGVLVDDPAKVDIEIVRWPAPGWRPVDSDSGGKSSTRFNPHVPTRTTASSVRPSAEPADSTKRDARS